MYSIVQIIFGAAGLIFWAIAILLLRLYFQTKTLNNLFLGSYFIAIGWLMPLYFFIPVSEDFQQYWEFYLLTSNFLLPISLVCLNLFIDSSLKKRFHWETYFTVLLGGIIIGLLITVDKTTIFVPSLYGLKPTMLVESTEQVFVAILLYASIILVSLRVLIQSLFERTDKPKQRKLIRRKKSKIAQKIAWIYSLSPMIWTLFSILERLSPFYFSGLDVLLIAVLYSFLIKYYFTNQEYFYHLPQNVKSLILNTKAGLNLLIYDFETGEYFDTRDKVDPSDRVPELIYASSIVMQQALFSHNATSEELSQIRFQSLGIIRISTQDVEWYFVVEDEIFQLDRIFKFIVKKIEKKFHADFLIFSKGIMPSPAFKAALHETMQKLF